jgi:alpha-amylase/alpha-mannosidase (GH57 family)
MSAVGPRYVCIHGHFYQPPRESPWLEVVERQDSAWPFHDWNERVHAECYAPNATARILDAQGRIERISNNYASISYNFGATLLSWMEEASPEVYRRIVAADQKTREQRDGHGSALAQVYGHVILPLANERDKRTQVIWGVRDFAHRFGRRPRGMWLSETACDTATLEALAEQGIELTVLAPHQARRVRPTSASAWHDVLGGRIDTRRAYEIALPSGRTIAAFFYDGPTSRAVAFERLLDDGSRFARRLTAAFDGRSEPQLSHIATDGETYGHHHRFGEMALAYALSVIEEDPSIRLTTYEEFLTRHPPEWRAEIVEATSWSCEHGVERWRANCGCKTGGPPQWTQDWRAPLRAALDWLRDQLIEVFETEGARLFRDPWAARDGYIDVVLDRSDESVRRFLAEHQRTDRDAPLADPEIVRALELLEMQRHAMLMYTSCGWFFDDLGGIETVQVIEYAARAVQLATVIAGDRFEAPFLARLAAARSNRAELGDGKDIYLARVRPAMIDLRKVGAHFAAASLFEEYRDSERVFGFDVDVLEREHASAGQARLAFGRMRVRSRVTWASEELSFAVLHLGDHNLSGGVRTWDGAASSHGASSHGASSHAAMTKEINEAFGRADIAEVLRAIERHFPGGTYSLRTLFRDEQKKILDEVLGATLEGVERDYEQIYSQFAPLMRYLASLGQPVPKALHQAAEYTLTARLRRELERGRDVDLEAGRALVREARDAGVTLEGPELGRATEAALEEMLAELTRNPDDLPLLELTRAVASFAGFAGLRFDPVVSQNRFYEMRESVYGARRVAPMSHRPGHDKWIRAFRELGAQLGVRVD